MLNQQIPLLFTLISHNSNSLFTHCFRKDIKKSSYEIRNCLIFNVDQPGLEPGTSRL